MAPLLPLLTSLPLPAGVVTFVDLPSSAKPAVTFFAGDVDEDDEDEAGDVDVDELVGARSAGLTFALQARLWFERFPFRENEDEDGLAASLLRGSMCQSAIGRA